MAPRSKIEESHEVESCVRGFHVYKDKWTPTIGETLSCELEDGNLFDPYAVAIKKGTNVIGHIPRKISAACSLFLEMSGTLTCEITDSNHQYSFDLPQGGLQIPCKLVFKSRDATLMKKMKWLVKTVPDIEVNFKQTAPLKRNLELPLKPPAKKTRTTKAKKPAASASSSASNKTAIIDLDQKLDKPLDRDVAKEIPWVNFSRQALTAVDKSLI